ncbi:methyl-accepting chemotaxis protein [Paraburkholderia phenoliruptrix]|uniref:methyl-accepting chemotaxis protein n=1 Tax=Paraburkholderia phenoliruptrix TaxID=252970 RepID=UPI0034CE9FFC
MATITVKSQLALIAGSMGISMLVIASSGLYGMGQTGEALRSVYEDRTVCIQQLAQVSNRLQDQLLALSRATLEPQTNPPTAAIERADKDRNELEAVWKDYMSSYLTPTEKQLADAFRNSYDTLETKGFAPLRAALAANQQEQASTVLHQAVDAAMPQAMTAMRGLRQLQVDVAKSEYEASRERFSLLRSLLIALAVAGVAIGTGVSIVMGRRLYRALGGEPTYAVEMVRTIADGNLTTTIRHNAADRHSLVASLESMRQQLSGVVTGIKSAAESISVAAGEIAQGNVDLSQRTEEQAASLEETAASMEELTSTVRMNTENALQASSLANTASSTAAQGGDVVERVVTTMRDISSSSSKVAEIITVIEGIAFQTNILALNAAVEAARAGEEGRGFAVVAGEVRTLAQRSATAAKEIKELIGASVQHVNAGSSLVVDAGTTMNELVHSVQRVTQIMTEIANASNEQSNGIEQVNVAVSQMDEVTQQNAALVEQATAAAQAMAEQANSLRRAVAVFRVAQA